MNTGGSALIAHCGAKYVSRDDLREIPIPEGTKTHQPLSHYEIVEVLEEALSFRHVSVVRDEYAVSSDGMKMFGVMDLNNEFSEGRFSIGLRNSNDKSMRLALTAGYRVFVCDNMAFTGDFTPLLQKHTRNLELRDSISIAVDRIHRGFDRLEEQIKGMQGFLLTDNDARLLIYQAFVEGRIKAMPKYLLPVVHYRYFSPEQEEFRPRNLWSLSNAFTSAFKQLSPIKHFEVTAKLGTYLKEFQVAWNGNAASLFDLSDRSNEARFNEAGRETPLIDCGTDLVRFEKPDEITGSNLIDHQDQIASKGNRRPNNSDLDELAFDSDSDDNFGDEVDFDETGDLVDSVIEDYSREVAA